MWALALAAPDLDPSRVFGNPFIKGAGKNCPLCSETSCSSKEHDQHITAPFPAVWPLMRTRLRVDRWIANTHAWCN